MRCLVPTETTHTFKAALPVVGMGGVVAEHFVHCIGESGSVVRRHEYRGIAEILGK